MSQPESARSTPPIYVTRLRFGVRRSPVRCVMSAARTNSEFAIDAAAGSGVQNQKSRQGRSAAVQIPRIEIGERRRDRSVGHSLVACRTIVSAGASASGRWASRSWRAFATLRVIHQSSRCFGDASVMAVLTGETGQRQPYATRATAMVALDGQPNFRKLAEPILPSSQPREAQAQQEQRGAGVWNSCAARLFKARDQAKLSNPEPKLCARLNSPPASPLRATKYALPPPTTFERWMSTRRLTKCRVVGKHTATAQRDAEPGRAGQVPREEQRVVRSYVVVKDRGVQPVDGRRRRGQAQRIVGFLETSTRVCVEERHTVNREQPGKAAGVVDLLISRPNAALRQRESCCHPWSGAPIVIGPAWADDASASMATTKNSFFICSSQSQSS